jgi:hypothetical protein
MYVYRTGFGQGHGVDEATVRGFVPVSLKSCGEVRSLGTRGRVLGCGRPIPLLVDGENGREELRVVEADADAALEQVGNRHAEPRLIAVHRTSGLYSPTF